MNEPLKLVGGVLHSASGSALTTRRSTTLATSALWWRSSLHIGSTRASHINCRFFAVIFLYIELNILAFSKRAKTRSMDDTLMNKDISPAIVWDDKAEALRCIKKLYFSGNLHF